MKAYLAGKPLLSTTDWPGTACCVVFFVGCNLRCRFCFNAPLLEFKEEFNTDLSNIFEELRIHEFLIDGVIATGGEPTLQPDAVRALAEWSRDSNLKFGLMTNGTKPDVLKKLIDDDLLDYVAVDIKTRPNEKEYAHVTQASTTILSDIKTTISLLNNSKVTHEYRTTLVPSLVDQIPHIQQIMDWVGSTHYVLQSFRPANTVLDPTLSRSFSSEELDKFRKFANNHHVETRF